MKTSINPSVWEKELPGLDAAPLPRDPAGFECSVCIVGAGIAGMTTAYLLARQGSSVIILDAGSIGGGETKHTTAHLSNAIDSRYFEMIRIHGTDGAHLIAESHTAAINRIAAIVETEDIACDFDRVDGYLFVPPRGDPALLEHELLAAHRAGLGHVEKLDIAPIADFDTGPCLLFPQQGQFHPLKYLEGLRAAIERDGGRIYGHTHVADVEGGENACVKTDNGQTIRAQSIVVATNTPVNDRIAMHTKQAAYRTYAIGAEIPSGSVRKALFWDTLDPYHYARVQDGEGSDLLIVGGEDHRTGQANDAPERFARLERWARERFPMVLGVPFRWSGQVMETMDGVAFIGRNPGDAKNVFIATGDCGMGMTHGTIAGMILSDLIFGRRNRWAAFYDPARKRTAAAGEFARENLNVASCYADYVTTGDASSEADIAPGAGAVLRHGLRKIAVYRDEIGVCHSFSAICPHMKCIVRWNSLEKTWDCPCHGSRFTAMGQVVNGPAISNLTPVGQPAHA